MSTAQPERPPEAAPGAARGSERKLGGDEIILVVLLALSALGIAVSQIAPREAFWYWLAMVPVFGGINLFAGWSRARARGMTAAGVLRNQLLHWAALAVAVCLVFLLQYTGRMNSEDAGLVTLLALALTTFLAGVYSDWRYCVVGTLLAAAVAAVALLKVFVWPVVIVAVAVAAFLVYRSRRDSGG
jgi:hypothetical protein